MLSRLVATEPYLKSRGIHWPYLKLRELASGPLRVTLALLSRRATIEPSVTDERLPSAVEVVTVYLNP